MTSYSSSSSSTSTRESTSDPHGSMRKRQEVSRSIPRHIVIHRVVEEATRTTTWVDQGDVIPPPPPPIEEDSPLTTSTHESTAVLNSMNQVPWHLADLEAVLGSPNTRTSSTAKRRMPPRKAQSCRNLGSTGTASGDVSPRMPSRKASLPPGRRASLSATRRAPSRRRLKVPKEDDEKMELSPTLEEDSERSIPVRRLLSTPFPEDSSSTSTPRAAPRRGLPKSLSFRRLCSPIKCSSSKIVSTPETSPETPSASEERRPSLGSLRRGLSLRRLRTKSSRNLKVLPEPKEEDKEPLIAQITGAAFPNPAKRHASFRKHYHRPKLVRQRRSRCLVQGVLMD